MKELTADYDTSNDFINHATMKVYNNEYNDFGCDILLQMNDCLFPTYKNLLTSKVDFFQKMFDKGAGWSENESQEYYLDIPIIQLKMKLSPNAFYEWLQSLRTGKFNLTVNNCIKLHSVVNFFAQTKNVENIEAFIEENMDFLNPIEILDNCQNLEEKALSRIVLCWKYQKT